MTVRRWSALLISIGVGCLVVVSYHWLSQASVPVNERDLITISRVDFPMMVDGNGVMEAARSVSIGPPVIANMRRFRLSRMVEEGIQVEEGDFLAEFDGSEISQRLRDVTTNFQKVQEEFRKKRSDFDVQIREQKLLLEQRISDYEKLVNKLNVQVGLESALAVEETRRRKDMAAKAVEFLERKIQYLEESAGLDLKISRSNEAHYQAIMDDLLDALDSLKVRAPVPGVVVYQRDWNNEPREIGSSVFALDSVMQIPDLSTLRVKVWVDEVDSGKVSTGQEAIIQVEALQGKTYRGRLSSLSSILRQASYDSPQKVAEAIVSLNDPDYDLMRPGMSTRVRILVGEHRDAIAIPLSSIRERDGRSFVQVWLTDREEWEWREIELQFNDGVAAVVKTGLAPGEKIRSKPFV